MSDPEQKEQLPSFMQKSDRAATTAREGIEALELLISERDQLRIRNSWLEAELLRIQALLEQASLRVNTLQHERDHYMRAVTEMTTHFNHAVATMNDCMAKARDGTYARPTGQLRTEVQPAISNEEAERIRALARKLAPVDPTNMRTEP